MHKQRVSDIIGAEIDCLWENAWSNMTIDSDALVRIEDLIELMRRQIITQVSECMMEEEYPNRFVSQSFRDEFFGNSAHDNTDQPTI